MNFTRLASYLFIGLMIPSLCAKETTQKKTKVFEDQKLSILVPIGTKIEADPENNKYIFFFDKGFLHIKLIGPKEDLKISHQRAETALKELQNAGINKPVQQGNAIITIN